MPVINPSGGASGLTSLLHVSGSLAPAQILTLNSAPTQLVAAPGANKAWIPQFGFLVIVGGGVAYANGGDLAVGPAAHLLDSLLQFPGSMDALHNFSAAGTYVGNGYTPSFDPASEFANVPLVLGCRTADFTAGNGTLNYSVYYELAALI